MDKESLLKELHKKGYCRYDAVLMNDIREEKMRSRVIRFKAYFSAHAGDRRYSANDLFGKRSMYLVLNDPNHIESFIEFIVGEFYMNNRNPGSGPKAAFTQLLHNYNFHWHGCRHTKKAASVYVRPDFSKIDKSVNSL